MGLDRLGLTLIARIEELGRTRAGFDRQDLGDAIGRGRSWISEFYNRQRTTNDLRLVVAMARYFKVPVGFLLGEAQHADDALTVNLLGVWADLPQNDRETLLQIALRLHQRPAPAGTIAEK